MNNEKFRPPAGARFKTIEAMIRVRLIVGENIDPTVAIGAILNQAKSGIMILEPWNRMIEDIDLQSLSTGRPESFEKAKGVHPQA